MSKCGFCGKTVYKMEEVLAGKFVFHKLCFKCTSCQSPLAKGSQKEGPDGRPFCAKCYGANWGPKGFRGGAVDGSVSVTEHVFDTKSHVK